MSGPWTRSGEPPKVFRASLVFSRDKYPDLVRVLWGLPHGALNGFVRDALLAHLRSQDERQQREAELARQIADQTATIEQLAQAVRSLETALQAGRWSVKAPPSSDDPPAGPPSEGAARFAKRF